MMEETQSLHDALVDHGVRPELLSLLEDRLAAGAHTDAVLMAFRHLTEQLRELGGKDGDGVALVGQALGGNAPPIRINPLRKQSDRDEQKGLEQLVRGLYTGIRNPRTHEHREDTAEFCFRIVLVLDTVLDFLENRVTEFDVDGFCQRIFDPHFVPSHEYAEAVIADVPESFLFDAFREVFHRRSEGDPKALRFAFEALLGRMDGDSLKQATEVMAGALRGETEAERISEVLEILRSDLWGSLPADVRLRLERMVVESCRQGSYDYYQERTEGGDLGRWGSKFGKDFSSREDLVHAIVRRLYENWGSQNYVARHYLYALPDIVPSEDEIAEVARAMTYALVTNKAYLLRGRFKEVCPNYPPDWRQSLREQLQAHHHGDPEYVEEVLSKLV